MLAVACRVQRVSCGGWLRCCLLSVTCVSVWGCREMWCADNSASVQRVSGGGGRPSVRAAEPVHDQRPCGVPSVCVVEQRRRDDDVGWRHCWFCRQYSDHSTRHHRARILPAAGQHVIGSIVAFHTSGFLVTRHLVLQVCSLPLRVF